MIESEIWKPINNTHGIYEVSNFGKVRSYMFRKRVAKTPTIMRPQKNGGGYTVVSIKFVDCRRIIQVHNLVAQAFIGPQGKYDWVRHKDGNNANNHVENLEYYNQRKFSDKPTIDKISKMYIDGETIESIAKKLNTSMTSINNALILNKTKKRVPHWFHEKHVNIDYFKVIDTPRKAYWLGLIYADGCIVEREKENGFRVFSLSLKYSDKYLLEQFNYDVGSDYKIIESTKKITDGAFGYNKREYAQCSITISNQKFCENLVCCGIIPRKSLTCNLPRIISDDSLWGHFFRGYWDGDGTIFTSGKTNTTQISACVSLPFGLSSVDLLNNDYGFNFTLNTSKSQIHILRLAGKKSFKFLEWIYKDADIYLERKYKKYIEAIQVRIQKDTQSTSRENPIIQFDKNFNELARFKSITIAAKQTGISKYSISKHLYGFSKDAGGYLWDYDTRYWIPKYRGKQEYGATE